MDILRVMNKRKKLALVVILCIASLVMARMGISTKLSNEDINLNTNEVLRPRSATEHGPIYINGNAELAAFCAGNGTDGTESNPHIIEGYEIDLSTHSDPGIEISNTDLHVIIRNCSITNGAENYDNGIYLWNCTNVNITKNELTNNDEGIYLSSSSNNTIS